jgi:hypothetical protein
MSKQIGFLVFAGISLLIAPVLALNDSIGKSGINALRLHQPPYNLLGRKIGIGQVEVGRPVKLGQDKATRLLEVISQEPFFIVISALLQIKMLMIMPVWLHR